MNHFSFFGCLFLLLPFVSQSQTIEKNLYKKIPFEYETSLNIDLIQPAEIKYWDRKIIRIDTKLEFEGANSAILKGLIVAGRYAVLVIKEKQTIRLSAPNLEKILFFKSGALKEKVSYTIYVPQNLKIILNGESVASNKISSNTSKHQTKP